MPLPSRILLRLDAPACRPVVEGRPFDFVGEKRGAVYEWWLVCGRLVTAMRFVSAKLAAGKGTV